MPNETITVTTSKEKFFLEYLILKKPIIDSMIRKITGNKKARLSDKPMRVLAQLLYFNDRFKDQDDIQRSRSLFSKETKDIICDNLGIPEHHLNIYISQLRNFRIIDNKKIRPIFVIYADDHSVTFTFKLNGHSK